MKNLFYIFFLVTLFGCTNTKEFNFPVGELAASFVPANQDSVLFTTNKLDSSYLIYSPKISSYARVDYTNLERIQQKATCLDCPFFLSYLLNAGPPVTDSVGQSSKIDLLLLTSQNSTNFLNISNTAVSGNLYFLDTLLTPDSTYFFNVFTDTAQFYFTQSAGIIGYKKNNNWYFKNN